MKHAFLSVNKFPQVDMFHSNDIYFRDELISE